MSTTGLVRRKRNPIEELKVSLEFMHTALEPFPELEALQNMDRDVTRLLGIVNDVLARNAERK
jgi:hypothetical protein